ncbi:MAG: hypothetical protein PWQ50_1994, partial [Methanolobus sp.]|nr:hypothetical protein [Methanolobus sp.]
SALNKDDLEYLLSLIKTGEESLGCVQPHYMTIFIEMITEKLGQEKASEVMSVYAMWNEC